MEERVTIINDLPAPAATKGAIEQELSRTLLPYPGPWTVRLRPVDVWQGDGGWSIEVSRPGSGAGEGGKESKSMIVTIYGTGDIEIEGRMVDARAVRANVEKMHAVKPENGVMVVADKVVPSGLLVEVLDQIRLGGVDDISFGATK